jgi:hypothetical protein
VEKSVVALVSLLACHDAGPPVGDRDGSDPTDTAPTTAVETGDSGAPPWETAGIRVIRAPTACADPAPRSALGAFERQELGLDWTFAEGWRTPGWDVRYGARGIVVGDFDRDGHLDVIAPQELETTRILMGAGDGHLSEAPERLAPNPALTGAIGGATADWDADGDLDVFLYGQLTPALLLLNDGAGHFAVEVHPEWDVLRIGCGGSAAFGDMDLDGDLDLFYGRMGWADPSGLAIACTNRLLVNEGGAFVDRSELLPADVQAIRGTAGGFHQFDADLEPELYVVGLAEEEFYGTNLLLDRQPDGSWAALHGNGLDVPIAGMGMAAADTNDDGIMDVAIAGFEEIKYLQSVLPGVWANASAVAHLVPDPAVDQVVAWGGEFADYDLDGHLDVSFTFGTTLRSPLQQPDEIWRWEGDSFVPTGAAWGVADREVNRGTITADLNEDGWPDWIKRELGGVVFLDVSRCGDASWLDVRLHQDTANPDAIGARVRVIVGDAHQDRTIVAGSTSLSSGGPPVAMFGLGAAEKVDRLEVTWPDGAVTTWGPQDARQVLEVSRP